MIGTGFYTCESCQDIIWTTTDGITCWCCGRCVGVEAPSFVWQNPCTWTVAEYPLPVSA